jgi:hypothetical protein
MAAMTSRWRMKARTRILPPQRVDLEDALEKQGPAPTQGQQLRPGRRIRGTRAVRARA